VHRPIHRWLLSLLLLLALAAGGTILSPLEMPGSASIGDMTDKSCASCGKATAPSSCDAVCIALPGIATATFDLDLPPSQPSWKVSSETGATHFIAPDTSPPRA
jgi:hypothetical protein